MPSHRDQRFARIVQPDSFSNSKTGCDETNYAIEPEVWDPERQLLSDLYDRTRPLHPWKTIFRSNASPDVTPAAMKSYPDFYSLNLCSDCREDIKDRDTTAEDDYSTSNQTRGPVEGEMPHKYNFELEIKNLNLYEGLKEEDTFPFPVTSLDDPSELFTYLFADRKDYNELKDEDIIERAMEMLTLVDSEEKGTLSVEDHRGLTIKDGTVTDNGKQTMTRHPLKEHNLNVGEEVHDEEKGTLSVKENDGGTAIDVKVPTPSADEIIGTDVAGENYA